LRLANVLGGCQSKSSSSSSSSPSNILVDGFDGLRVSWEGEGDNLLPLQIPLLCFIAVSGGSGVSALYFNVVDGSIAIVLLSALKLCRGVVRLCSGGNLRFELLRFIMIPPSSESLSS